METSGDPAHRRPSCESANLVSGICLSSRVAKEYRRKHVPPPEIISGCRTSPQFAQSLTLRWDSQTEHLSNAWSGSGTLSGFSSLGDDQSPKSMMVVICEPAGK